MNFPKPVSFFLWSFAAQAIGFAAALLASNVISSPLVQILIHSIVAFLCAGAMRLSRPWQIFNLAVPLLVPALAAFQIPSWIIFGTVLVLLLIYIPTFWTRVPFYPTSLPMYEAILEQLPDSEPFTFMDFGCGFGSLLVFLAEKRPLGRFAGVEISPLPFLVSKARGMFSRNRIEIAFADFWKLDVSSFDYVYAFLAPPPMADLWKKCISEMKKGSVLLINSFPVPARPDKEIHVDDARKTVLYVHRINFPLY